MSMIRFNPYGLSALQQQINRVLEDFDRDLTGRSEELSSGMFAPPMDVKEDAEAYTVLLEVPGVPRDRIEITLQQNTLVIRGTREQTRKESQEQYRRLERSFGSFARSLQLPRSVESGAVTAQLQDGVLTVRLPKAADSKPRQIAIGGTVHEGTAVPGTSAGDAAPTGDPEGNPS